jgi:hypothetical protein
MSILIMGNSIVSNALHRRLLDLGEDVQLAVAEGEAQHTALLQKHQPDLLFYYPFYNPKVLSENYVVEVERANVKATVAALQIAISVEVPHFVLISNSLSDPVDDIYRAKRAAEREVQLVVSKDQPIKLSIVHLGDLLDESVDEIIAGSGFPCCGYCRGRNASSR